MHCARCLHYEENEVHPIVVLDDKVFGVRRHLPPIAVLCCLPCPVVRELPRVRGCKHDVNEGHLLSVIRGDNDVCTLPLPRHWCPPVQVVRWWLLFAPLRATTAPSALLVVTLPLEVRLHFWLRGPHDVVAFLLILPCAHPQRIHDSCMRWVSGPVSHPHVGAY
jgi:hypothetical protein